MDVLPISADQTHAWLRRIHYAARIPVITDAFGLYQHGALLGVVTYGVPASSTLRDGIAGKENGHLVRELTRLVLESPIENGPSILVGRSLQSLAKPTIVVSYADTSMGHVGYVYQACNFIYTGLSAKRTDWKLKGFEHLHGQTIADMSSSAKGGERGSRAAFMREKFGDDFYLEERARKHRYIYICGTSKQKKQLRLKIRYAQEPYPKGDIRRYLIADKIETQMILL